VLQSAFSDRFAFDPFSLQDDGLASAEVDVVAFHAMLNAETDIPG
jgi:hypothetical protein